MSIRLVTDQAQQRVPSSREAGGTAPSSDVPSPCRRTGPGPSVLRRGLTDVRGRDDDEPVSAVHPTLPSRPPQPSLLPAPALPALDAWGLDVVDELPIVGGLDPDAAVWQVRDRSGDEWAVKATRRDCRFGLALAAALGPDSGVVAPLSTRAGDHWAERDGLLVSVSPWILGDDAAEEGRGLDLDQWTELGTVVRRVHDQPPPSSIAPLRAGVKRTGRRARVRLRDLDARFVGAGQAPGVDPELAELWHAHRDRLRHLETTALHLKEARGPTTRVSCHGDPHLGNVVVDPAGRPWLIDLDEATVAPREVDLVLVDLGVLPGLPVEPEHRAAFRAGYGDDVRLDDDRITRFGCVRALEDVTAVFAALEGAHSPQHDGDLLGVRAGLDDLLGPRGLVSLVEERLARPAPARNSTAPITPAPITPAPITRAPSPTAPTPGEPT
jgi:spectinomycin phosphotransferase